MSAGPAPGLPIEVLGLTFVGTRTHERAATAQLARDVLGLVPTSLGDELAPYVDAFALPDGSTFVVSALDDGEQPERTVGFLVRDLAAAVTALRGAGVDVDDEISVAGDLAYAHLRGPDGRLYELVERRGAIG